MTELIDISTAITDELPVWPGSPPFQLEQVSAIEAGADANGSHLTMDVHMGTHVDAPLHGFRDGGGIGTLALARVVGDAHVAAMPTDVERIGARELEEAGVPEGTTKLLLKTANSSGDVYRREFSERYAALTLEGARWVADRGIELIGIDYLSIQKIEDSFDTHRALLGADVWILEGIDLAAVKPGPYELICLPLSLPNAEAAPARALLRPL